MMQVPELAACPICGGTCRFKTGWGTEGLGVFIQCLKCNLKTKKDRLPVGDDNFFLLLFKALDVQARNWNNRSVAEVKTE